VKTRSELIGEIIDAQNLKIISCEVDLTLYERRNLIVKNDKEAEFYTKKIQELKTIKERAEETLVVLMGLLETEAKKSANIQ
jgi:hypothetical protein